MRNKKLAWNTLSALIYQVTAVLCGFILPRAILSCYGSEVNGLVNSVGQFLEIIAFLELGVGAVIQSALYKPLADGNSLQVSEVVASGNNFFRKLGSILIGYVMVLVVIFPMLVNNTFGFAYNATLILSMSISYFARYYFGIVDDLLLSADQKLYVRNIIDTFAVIINAVICYALVFSGHSIQTVQITTSGIYVVRRILVRIYIRRNYEINRKYKYTKDPVEQKWNGIAQHIAAIVLDSTDIVVLSVFSTMSNVSIYSVYTIVITGLKNLILRFFSGVDALFGELWAKQEREALNRYFGFVEWIVHTVSLFVWCCTYKLVVPFVLIYTENVTDVNYNAPVFAAFICVASTLYCLRLPFNSMILAAGHYKNTQGIFVTAAVVNLVLSILAVKCWGLIGVAIGTIVAMLYQMTRMGYYVIRQLEIHSFKRSAKQFAFDIITVAFILCATSVISETASSWMGWAVLAVKHAAVIAACIIATNLVFYKEASMKIFKKVFKKRC